MVAFALPFDCRYRSAKHGLQYNDTAIIRIKVIKRTSATASSLILANVLVRIYVKCTLSEKNKTGGGYRYRNEDYRNRGKVRAIIMIDGTYQSTAMYY